MVWLWESWEEYVEAVHPAVLDSSGQWRVSCRSSSFETVGELWEAFQDLDRALKSLHDLGFSENNHKSPPIDSGLIGKARDIVLSAIYSGEKLLLLHKRLAKSDSSYGFLHQHNLLEHWDRYAKSTRIGREIQQFSCDVAELLDGYRKLVHAEDRFILHGLDLPETLESDFRMARNLFSLGFDEVGLLIAGRGLEAVLRKILDRRKIEMEIKGKVFAAADAEFYDLIETMFQLKWKRNGARMITPEVRALLHYLRTLRNAGAHPATHGSRMIAGPRETAILVAETANRLWKEATTRAQLAPTKVVKTW